MSSPLTDDVLDRVYRRANTLRRQRRWRAVSIAVPVLVVLIAIPLVVTSRQDDASQVVTDDGATQGDVPPAGSVIYAVGIPESQQEAPPILQIDAATMTVRTRYAIPQLPQTTIPAEDLPTGIDEPIFVGGSSPDSLRLSSDGSTLYFRILGGTCGGTIYAIDVNDPSSARPVVEPPEGTGVGDFVPTSDGRIVWYRCAQNGSSEAIVITDLVTGDEREIAYDGMLGPPGFSVSPDARTLAVASYTRGILPAEVRILSLDSDSESLMQDAQPLVPTAGCGFDLPRFNPATGELYILENCGPILGQGGRLIARNLETGASRQILAVGEDTALVDYSIDATGKRVLYAVDKAMNPTGRIGDGAEPATYRLDEGEQPVRLQLLPNAMPASRGGGNLVW